MLIEIVDSRHIDCPILYYEAEVIPSKGDSVSMGKTAQYEGFCGIVLGVNHHIAIEGLGLYPKASYTVVLEMKE
jgi:hypothetical protein